MAKKKNAPSTPSVPAIPPTKGNSPKPKAEKPHETWAKKIKGSEK